MTTRRRNPGAGLIAGELLFAGLIAGAGWWFYRSIRGATVPDNDQPPTPPALPSGRQPSGIAWVAQFPTRSDTAALDPSFRPGVERFIAAMRAGGATVDVSATERPEQRAYLMHWCYAVAVKGLDPAQVPLRPDVPIDWIAGGVAGAAAMNAAYHQVSPGASLTSLHIKRQAIDMTITWKGNLVVRNASGQPVNVGPGDGGTNRALWAVGATYGVKKLANDLPHWSTTGH